MSSMKWPLDDHEHSGNEADQVGLEQADEGRGLAPGGAPDGDSKSSDGRSPGPRRGVLGKEPKPVGG